MADKIKLGISACLTGEKVRYDGQHKLDHYLMDVLGRYFDWVPVCPEVGCGMPVPREAMRLVGEINAPRLVTIKTNIDHTELMQKWSSSKINELATMGLCGFVFKSKSPSSGLYNVKVYNKSGYPVKQGVGLFAKAFCERFPLLPVEEEGRLNDVHIRENFIEKVFAFARWRDYERNDGSIGGLVAFHTRHKLQLMAHSPEYYRKLGKCVAEVKLRGIATTKTLYLPDFLKGLSFAATVKKNVNVMQHILGYFKHDLTADEKAEMLELINNYHQGISPLIVAITMLNHYIRKYDKPYLQEQYYLHPNPDELSLRNHA